MREESLRARNLIGGDNGLEVAVYFVEVLFFARIKAGLRLPVGVRAKIGQRIEPFLEYGVKDGLLDRAYLIFNSSSWWGRVFSPLTRTRSGRRPCRNRAGGSRSGVSLMFSRVKCTSLYGPLPPRSTAWASATV